MYATMKHILKAKDTLKLYRQIKCKLLPRHERLGLRIKIWEEAEHPRGSKRSRTFDFDGDINDTVEQTVQILLYNGFKPVCRTYQHDYNVILCEYNGFDYKNINELK